MDVQTLYFDHHRWLVNWLRSRLGCTEDARDLAQDTFVRVLARPLAVGGLHKPRAWLATIAHGLMVDHVRRRDLEAAYCRALAELPERHQPSPEERMFLIDTLTQIDAMLKGLDAKVRSAFLLSRLEGLPYPKIAQRLGVSLSSVEKYMASAIRHCLAAQQDTETSLRPV